MNVKAALGASVVVASPLALLGIFYLCPRVAALTFCVILVALFLTGVWSCVYADITSGRL